MKTIKCYDSIFGHFPYSVRNTISDYIIWDINSPIEEVKEGELIFFTDNNIKDVTKFKHLNIRAFLWLIESPIICPQQMDALEYQDHYEKIFTLRQDFLDISDKFLRLPMFGSTIPYNERKIYEKNKLVSIVASHKRNTPLQRLRHSIIAAFPDEISIYGSGYNPIAEKTVAHAEYLYGIIIENVSHSGYFSEKLLDCILCGSLPIYLGDPDIGKFFNMDGIIQFTDLDSLDSILKTIDQKYYNSKIDAIKENFEIANRWKCPEDFITTYPELQIFNNEK